MSSQSLQRTFLAVAALALLAPLAGCVMVGGYSSRSGFFIWPGSIVLMLVFFLIFFLRRRR